ncbi:hypothetical protein [Haloarchaeobius sp. DFWS5]|uniref:hypothetical protein n=1 Tax=Haloarchaeobius sp. DFWS5 TaxID=3446114 RepID=UPI003EBE6BC4
MPSDIAHEMHLLIQALGTGGSSADRSDILHTMEARGYDRDEVLAAERELRRDLHAVVPTTNGDCLRVSRLRI